MSESRQLLTKVIRGEAESPGHTVAAITDLLLSNHADLVDDLVSEYRTAFVSDFVGTVLRQDRHEARRRSPREILAERAAAGVSVFDLSFMVDDEFTRKPLGDMTGADHRFVAATYDRQADDLRGFAAFHRDLADKVGRKLTRNVFSEAALERLIAERKVAL